MPSLVSISSGELVGGSTEKNRCIGFSKGYFFVELRFYRAASILSRTARVNSWVEAWPPISRVRVTLVISEGG